ncbi:hypothetical protein AX16_003139 [Volvariella volvacea WC 439]|nr:hypothetical protein AX16_003139 [Volvariella volvacea WC 439]
MDFQPVVVQAHPRPAATDHSPESRYWRQFKYPVFVKEYAPVTSIHFSPARPHRYAVTAATRVQIYAPRTQKVTKTITRFKDIARSGNIREDGKLVVAGDDSGLVQMFDLNSRAVLRTFDEHKQPVHVTKFSALTPTQILTCSDDTSCKIWDVPSQVALTTFSVHTDYVRTGQISSTNPNLILTGSYDGTIQLLDSRTGQSELTMGNYRHSNAERTPIEQVLMFPSGSAAVSSAGPIIRIWDIVAGGRCIRALSNHQKTITSLAFNSTASRLLTGGLDQMVKVYDVGSYKVKHTMRYPAPVLCLAISPDETHIAAGMSDGTLSVRRRQAKAREEMDNLLSLDTTLTAELHSVGQGYIKTRAAPKAIGDANELRIESRRTKRLKQYDKHLRNFKYTAALDSVLRKSVPPTTTFSLIQELIHRDGLRTALSGRDDVLLEPILKLLLKYLNDPRFGELVCDVAGLVVDMYAPVLGQSPVIDSLFAQLRKKVTAEIKYQRELVKTKGALMMLLALGGNQTTTL